MVLVVKIVKKNHGGLRNSFSNKNRPKSKRWEFDEVIGQKIKSEFEVKKEKKVKSERFE